MSVLTRVWDETLHAAAHELNEAERKLLDIGADDIRWNTFEAEVLAHVREARLLIVGSAQQLQAFDERATETSR